jgi:hypothetical protein
VLGGVVGHALEVAAKDVAIDNQSRCEHLVGHRLAIITIGSGFDFLRTWHE